MFARARPSPNRQVVGLIQACIAAIDTIISRQLNAVLHHPRLQRLESNWRGLHQLIRQSARQPAVRLRVIALSWEEICRDAERNLEFDHSALFKLIYSEEFDRPGGTPFGVLIGAYFTRHRPRDVQAMRLLAQVGAASFCPVVLNGDPALFGLERFDKLTHKLNLDILFAQPEYSAWRSLRQDEHSRFLMLTLPRTLMRAPYPASQGLAAGLQFEEQTTKTEDYCWGPASFSFAAVLIREFSQTQWFSHLRGAPKECFGGGLVTHLPQAKFQTDSPFRIRPATDILISDSLERQLADYGLTALCQHSNSTVSAFFSLPSLFASGPASNDRIAAMMQHLFCASRFAHHIKILARDKIGTFSSAQDCERLIDSWLRRYCMSNDESSLAAQAKYPLRDLSVEVKEHPEQPGHFGCIIRLKPQYQADHLLAEIKLTTHISATDRT